MTNVKHQKIDDYGGYRRCRSAPNLGKSRSTVSVLGKNRKISLTNVDTRLTQVGPRLTNDNDNDAGLLSLRPGSLDAAGTVAAIFANLLAGQCLRPQRLARGLDMSRILATLHPVVSTRCTLCGRGIRPPCALPRADPVLARGDLRVVAIRLGPSGCNRPLVPSAWHKPSTIPRPHAY